MDLVKLAQSLISNMSPNNYQTPVLGAIRKFNADVFGRPDYSPAAIALALGVGGLGKSKGFGTFGKGVKVTKPARLMTWDQLIAHEGAPDKARVNQYINQIWQGKPIDPLKVVKEGTKYGVEDGKHRLEAMKALNIRDIPINMARKYGN